MPSVSASSILAGTGARSTRSGSRRSAAASATTPLCNARCSRKRSPTRWPGLPARRPRSRGICLSSMAGPICAPPIPRDRGSRSMSDPRYTPVDAARVPRFAGIATFMRTRAHDIADDLDVALVGVPFDMGVNYRPGARQGPAQVREVSRVIRRVHPTLGIKPFDICNVADVGDAPVNPGDLMKSIDMIEAFFARIHAVGAVPIAIGGDHTVPLPVLR